MPLCVWEVLGDFIKAFPRTSRLDLVLLIAAGPRLRGGAFEMLRSIFDHDVVAVWYSGESMVKVVKGLPEGGAMGTLTYTTLPDSSFKKCMRRVSYSTLVLLFHHVGKGTYGRAPVRLAMIKSSNSLTVSQVGLLYQVLLRWSRTMCWRRLRCEPWTCMHQLA